MDQCRQWTDRWRRALVRWGRRLHRVVRRSMRRVVHAWHRRRRDGDRRRAAGRAGESDARRWLEATGFRTLERNRRFAGVEVDLLMLGPDGFTVVLVEVKARCGVDLQRAMPKERQRRRLRRAAAAVRRRWPRNPVRIDVVLVLTVRGGQRCVHCVNAF